MAKKLQMHYKGVWQRVLNCYDSFCKKSLQYSWVAILSFEVGKFKLLYYLGTLEDEGGGRGEQRSEEAQWRPISLLSFFLYPLPLFCAVVTSCSRQLSFLSCRHNHLTLLVLLFCLFDSRTYCTLGFCPGGSLAHSHRGDLGGVAGFLPPKPVEEVTRNLAMLGTSNLQLAAHSPISDLDTLLANSTWQP